MVACAHDGSRPRRDRVSEPPPFFVADGDRFVPSVSARGPWSARHQHGGPPAFVSGPEVNTLGPSLNATGTAVGFAHMWSDKAPEPYVTMLQPFAPKQVATVQSLPPFCRSR